MDYKISDICNDLGIGKSTLYKRIDILKQSIPKEDWKKNEYFYYTSKNKLFFTEKGFAYIRDFKSRTDNIRQNSNSDVVMYQNQIIEIYKKRIEYLENENKRLLDIISVKEQREIAKDVKLINNINSADNISLFNRFLNKFKNKN